jgi:hypothetical protein
MVRTGVLKEKTLRPKGGRVLKSLIHEAQERSKIKVIYR